MKINSVSIETLGGKLKQYRILETDIPYYSRWAPKSLSPIIQVEGAKFKKLEVEVFIESNSRLTLEKNKSSILSACRRGTIIFSDSTMEYDSVLDSSSVEAMSNLACVLKLTFSAIMTEPETLINLNKIASQSVTIKGNSSVEVIYTITSPSIIASFTINDITITNIPANTEVIIDGVKKKVTSGGVNKFKDCTLTRFPTLNSGANTITMNSIIPTVTIKYKPRWC